ncbi:MAG: response regulator, partial [Treponema sp.]|nr:response regulator [Treponema sp.]
IKQADLILMVPHGFMGADTKMTLLRWFKGYINKPVKRRSLAETIDAVLNEPQELEALTDPKDVTDAAILNEANRGNQIPAQGAAPDKSVLPGKSALPILIAEDHPVNQKLFAAILEKLGYSAILADDGIEAVEKALANKVALILMDIQMPRMNGYEAAGKLRKTGFDRPIIAVTASALSDEREHCLNAGIDDVLIKPFKRADVEKILLKWVKAGDIEAAHTTEIPQTPEELSVSAIPVEGPDIVPVSKPDAVFDSAVITDTFMGNRELIGNLLPRFLERTQAQLKTIPDFKEAGDWESARREAHTIKGAAFTMSGSELGNAAAHLELAFLHNDHNAMETAYPLLQEAFSRFKKEAEDFLARGD